MSNIQDETVKVGQTVAFNQIPKGAYFELIGSGGKIVRLSPNSGKPKRVERIGMNFYVRGNISVRPTDMCTVVFIPKPTI